MANGVWHTGLNITIYLDPDDLGHPEIPFLWETLRSDRRSVVERQLQCLQCREERPDCPEWMYLREHSDGSREAVHFNTSIGAHPAAKESDEHKALKERIAAAGQKAGHGVEIEDRADDGRRRTDVTVAGENGLRIGWEVQLSNITEATVKKRSNIARDDGLTPSWMTSAKKLSELLRQTSWSLATPRPWQEVRDGREIRIAGGVRTLEMIHCGRWPGPCPVKKRGKCNEWHGRWEVYNPTLDELVRDTAAGQFVPAIIPMSRWMNRWWVRPGDRDLYAASVGGLPTEEDLKRGQKAKTAGSTLTQRELDRICRYGQASDYRSTRRVVADEGQVFDASAVTFASPRRGFAAPSPQPRILNWRSADHVARTPAPCRICGKPSLLLDDERRPAHKVCVEEEIQGGMKW